jgi:aspartyl-tRNA(Asn)/glutamyl-tRNA(Gln) amidotransferase subunit A
VTLLEAARALRKRKISSAELTRLALERITRLNPALNAFLTVTESAARARAHELDRELASGMDRGPLHGIPIAHKDCFATKGVRTTGGSKILADRVPDHDAEIVAQLDRAGAVMLGKTNLHELCYGITSNNPHFGAVHNPWDLERIPGGSSGGSAAAVASGMVFAATGTDTGGSIRVPAAFCGVVGLKPTYGRLSRRGVMPLGLSLDHVGPIARTVRDAATSFRAMAAQPPVTAPANVAGLRVGVPENFFFDRLEPEITSSIRHAVQTMAGLGARMMEVHLPDMEMLNSIGRLVLSAEAASVWKRYLDRTSDFGTDVLAALERGCLVPATEYLEAQQQRRVLSKKLAKLWSEIDCLLAPATPTTAPRIGDPSIRIDGIEEDVRVGSTRLVRPFNVLGWPAMAMPCGFSDEGLPIGLQLVAAPGEEETLFRVGAALEDSLGVVGRVP